MTSNKRVVTFTDSSTTHSLKPPLTHSTSENERPNGLGMFHGPGGCPGFTGGDAKQRVRPRTFRQLMTEDAVQIVIPLFQRKYCWDEAQGSKWFRDLTAVPKKNGWQGAHNTGKAIFKPLHATDNQPPVLICVDGQQRITTTSVLLIAILDAARAHGCVDAVSDDVVSLLWCANSCDAAETNVRWKVVPSLADRATYAALIGDPRTNEFTNSTNNHLASMKKVFDTCIENLLGGSANVVTELQRLLRQSVDEMYLVSIEIENEPDLAQVFLWLQEKSLLGMGSLLQNLAPGVEFHAADMVRNILFAPFMRVLGLGSVALTSAYRELWFDPIERKVSGPAALDQLIDSCMAHWYQTGRQASSTDTNTSWIAMRPNISPYEIRIGQTVEWFRSCGVLKYSTHGIERYARFLTFVDDVTPTVHPCTNENVARFLLSLICAQVE